MAAVSVSIVNRHADRQDRGQVMACLISQENTHKCTQGQDGLFMVLTDARIEIKPLLLCKIITLFPKSDLNRIYWIEVLEYIPKM